MTEHRRRRIDPEDAVLYGLMMGIGIIPVVIALIEQAAFGFDATLGLLMMGAGAVGIGLSLLRRR